VTLYRVLLERAAEKDRLRLSSRIRDRAIAVIQDLEAVNNPDWGTELGGRTIHDFSNWRDDAAFEAAFQRLLQDLGVGTAQRPAAPAT
jgi:hypothetical protein